MDLAVGLGLVGAIVGVIGIVLVWWVFPLVGKRAMLHPPHEAPYLTPGDMGMAHERVHLPTGDGLELVAWLVAPKDPGHPNAEITVVVLHGTSHSKAWMLDHYGRGLHAHGYQLLFVDGRQRGESPETPAGFTWCVEEVKDVTAAVDWLTGTRGVPRDRVVLFGESAGAATVLCYGATHAPVGAIIEDSGWAFGDAMIRRAYPARSGLPWRVIGQRTVKLLERHYGFTFAEISPGKLVPDLQTPTMLVHGNADRDIDPEDASRLQELIPASTPTELWRVDGRGHVEAYLEPDYFARVARFVETHIRP